MVKNCIGDEDGREKEVVDDSGIWLRFKLAESVVSLLF